MAFEISDALEKSGFRHLPGRFGGDRRQGDPGRFERGPCSGEIANYCPNRQFVDYYRLAAFPHERAVAEAELARVTSSVLILNLG